MKLSKLLIIKLAYFIFKHLQGLLSIQRIFYLLRNFIRFKLKNVCKNFIEVMINFNFTSTIKMPNYTNESC